VTTLRQAHAGRALKSARKRQGFELPLHVGLAPFLCLLVPVAGLREVRERTVRTDLPEQSRVIGRAEQERRAAVPGLCSAQQQQPCRLYVAAREQFLPAFDEACDFLRVQATSVVCKP